MSIPGNANPLLLASAAADAAAAGPIKSVRFNNDDSAYLNRSATDSGSDVYKFYRVLVDENWQIGQIKRLLVLRPTMR